jgi:hypothetical protein
MARAGNEQRCRQGAFQRSCREDRRQGSRDRGVPNKFTGDLKQAILAAFNGAHPEGLAHWVCDQAQDNPTSAMALLGRLIPVSMEGEIDHTHTVTIKFE